PDCNDPPIAANDNYTVLEAGTLNVPPPGVLANDTDPDGDPITAILVSGPAHASSFTFNANGSFNYVHDGTDTGNDSFTYKANDGSLDSNVATVTIVVTPVNDPPVANNDTFGVNEAATLHDAAPGDMTNDPNAEHNPLPATLFPRHALPFTFTFNANGSFNYMHDGTDTGDDSFTYRANDGTSFSNVATVTIHVTPVNDPPVANNDTFTVLEAGTLNVAVLTNDADDTGDASTASLVSRPADAASFARNAHDPFS